MGRTGPGRTPRTLRRTVVAATALLAATAASASCGAAQVSESADLASTEGRSADPAAPATTTAAPPTAAAASADRDGSAPDRPPVDGAAPTAPVDTAMTAGSVDDNAAWEDYLRYRAAALATGIDVEPFEVGGRTVLTVVDGDGRPVHGATLRVGPTDRPTVLRTSTDGRAVWFGPTAVDPNRQDRGDVAVEVSKGDASTDARAVPGTDATLTLAGAPRAAEVPVDILFLLDATGSMGDEIEQLKANISSVAERVGGSAGAGRVRLAMTAYRDRGDEFVTRSTDFTDDVAAFRSELTALRADGGGDYPEALAEGLADALDGPSWSDDPDAVRLVFLVGDAPPQRHPDGPRINDLQARAQADGVTILPIAANELDATGEFVFRQLALATTGRFVFLTYGADGASPGPATAMHVEDYAVLSLDDLVVRLVDEELAPLRR